MHNRARMITASFLTKDLCIDWRAGAAHFRDLLLDGDVANNSVQLAMGRRNRHRHAAPTAVLNPLRQADRFDPDGDYVRRYVPELAGLAGRATSTAVAAAGARPCRAGISGPTAWPGRTTEPGMIEGRRRVRQTRRATRRDVEDVEDVE